jgi:hypothetical protein
MRAPHPTSAPRRRRALGAAVAGLLLVGSAAACGDDDGFGETGGEGSPGPDAVREEPSTQEGGQLDEDPEAGDHTDQDIEDDG